MNRCRTDGAGLRQWLLQIESYIGSPTKLSEGEAEDMVGVEKEDLWWQRAVLWRKKQNKTFI